MSPQFNNLFAAVLIAGIAAMMAGFVANIVYHPPHLEEDAFPVEVAETDAGSGETAVPTADPITPDMMAAADAATGERLFRVCAACHTVDAGGPHRIGPNLAGVVNAPVGSKSGFVYSDALSAHGGRWTVDELNAYLWNPRRAIPGSKMAFAGMRKAEDRAAVIKYLQSQK